MSPTRTTATSLAGWIRQAKVEPAFVGHTVCRVAGCTTIPFVEVRYRDERLHVCLNHYQEARALADEGMTEKVA